MSKILQIHPENPQKRHIQEVVDVLNKGGIIVYPNDTVYALGCDAYNQKAMEKLARLKGIKLEKSKFSIICADLSHLSEFTKPINNTQFKLLKKALPGAFTFILEASKKVPNTYKNHKTIGLRVPDHKVPQAIIELLGRPISSTSIHNEDEILEYVTDPEIIHEMFQNQVDLIIDSGFGDVYASTIVDLTSSDPSILREGKGDLSQYI